MQKEKRFRRLDWRNYEVSKTAQFCRPYFFTEVALNACVLCEIFDASVLAAVLHCSNLLTCLLMAAIFVD